MAEPGRLVALPGADEPALRAVGLGYVYHDPRYGAALHFRRLQRGQDPSGWLTASLTLPALGTVELCTNRVLLMGSQNKAGLVKTLQRKAATVPVWDEILESACASVLRAMTQMHVEAAGPVDPRPQYRPDRIRHLVREGTLNLLYGPGGIGKGWLAVLGALCIQQGQPFCELPVQQGNVLYLDWEDDLDVFNSRVAVLAAGMGLRAERPAYIRCERALPDMLEDLLDEIAARDISTVVLDSVSKAFPRGEYGTYEATADDMAQCVRLLPVTWAIDHLTAGAVDSDSLAGKPIGGIGKVNAARNQWEARGHQDPDSCALYVALHQTKRNHTAALKPLSYALTFDAPEEPTALTIASADIHSVPELAQHRPIAEQVYYLLGHERLTYGELYQHLGATDDKKKQGAIQQAISRGIRADTYVRSGSGAHAIYWRPYKENQAI